MLGATQIEGGKDWRRETNQEATAIDHRDYAGFNQGAISEGN